MKKLNKKFLSRKRTVESMAICVCPGCNCTDTQAKTTMYSIGFGAANGIDVKNNM